MINNSLKHIKSYYSKTTSYKELFGKLISLLFHLFVALFTGVILADLMQKIWFGYAKESWSISEILINYQGGFVRRGLLGELIYWFSNHNDFSIYTLILLISIIAYSILILYFIWEFKKNALPIVILPFAFFLGGPVISDYWIRKDILIVLLFILVIKQASKYKFLNYLFMNIFLIIGILIHENMAFISFPILIIYFINRNSNVFRQQNPSFFFKIYNTILLLSPSLAAFLLVIVYKGNYDLAFSIWSSWLPVQFPIQNIEQFGPPASIEALSWNISRAFEGLKHTLHNFDGGIYAPVAWFGIVAGVIYVLSNFDILSMSSGYSKKTKEYLSNLSVVLLVQIFAIIPLFIIGWDYGRWIFLWVTSSFIIFFNFKDISDLLPNWYSSFGKYLSKLFQLNILRNRLLLAYVLLYLGTPAVGWSLGMFMHTSSIYYIKDTLKSLVQFIPFNIIKVIINAL